MASLLFATSVFFLIFLRELWTVHEFPYCFSSIKIIYLGFAAVIPSQRLPSSAPWGRPKWGAWWPWRPGSQIVSKTLSLSFMTRKCIDSLQSSMGIVLLLTPIYSVIGEAFGICGEVGDPVPSASPADQHEADGDLPREVLPWHQLHCCQATRTQESSQDRREFIIIMLLLIFNCLTYTVNPHREVLEAIGYCSNTKGILSTLWTWAASFYLLTCSSSHCACCPTLYPFLYDLNVAASYQNQSIIQ